MTPQFTSDGFVGDAITVHSDNATSRVVQYTLDLVSRWVRQHKHELMAPTPAPELVSRLHTEAETLAALGEIEMAADGVWDMARERAATKLEQAAICA